MTAGALGLGGDPERLPEVLSGLSRQNALYRRMIAICDQVGDAALRGADPRELTTVFARMVDKAVVLLDDAFQVLAQACGEAGDVGRAWNPRDEGTARVLEALARERRTIRVPAVPGSAAARGIVATPITLGDDVLGYLLVTDAVGAEQSDDVDLLIASYAATLFALTLAHQRTSTDLGQRYRAAILDALVSGNFLDQQDAHRKASTLGLTSSQPYRIGVLGARVTDEHPRRLVLSSDMANQLTGLFAARVPDAIAVVRGSEMVLLLPAPPGAGTDRSAEHAATALAAVTSLLARRSVAAQLTCGLSERLRAPDDAPRGLQQASHAIDLGLRIGRAGGVIAYDDLGVYRLLLQIGDMRQLWQFAEDVLGELIAYEATHRLDLIGTLSVYLSEHASLKQAARRLRVHTNTISYRIHRIEELTQLDLADADHRLSAHIAVKIIESQRAAQHSGADALPEQMWGADAGAGQMTGGSR